MFKSLFLSILIFFISYCENNMELESQNSNQPIRDLIDNDQTSSNSNSYRQPSTVSSTNSMGAVGNSSSGAVGTPPASPAVGGATGNYSGNPTTSGY